MEIDFLNLKKANEKYQNEFKESFSNFLDSGYYILGSVVENFENSFAKYCGTKYCIGVGNGLDALTLILKGYLHIGRLKKNDKIIVAANTYVATILAIKRVGLIPVLIEPNERTYNLDPDLLNMKQKPKAVLVTYLYGQLSEIEKISAFCKKNNLVLISDAAQAHGAEDEKRNKAGNIANAAGFSFYPTKNLGALGDGGAVTTNDTQLASYIKKIRNYGFSTKKEIEFIGVNSRLDEIQAAFLNIKLKYLDKENDRRRNIAKLYLEGITNPDVIKPFWDFSKNHVFHQFVIRVKNREQFQNYLGQNGVQTMVHYPIPPHKQKAFKGHFSKQFALTEKLSDEVVSLPINAYINNVEISRIIELINKF